jgi:VWFA-related protein
VARVLSAWALLSGTLAPRAAAATTAPVPPPGAPTVATAPALVRELPALRLESALWLLPAERQAELSGAPLAARERAADELLAGDPLPATPVNELAAGAELRRQLALVEVLTPLDDRGRALFLLGAPEQRFVVDCSTAFQPLEIWRWGDAELLLYQPAPERPWRAWSPAQGKGALYTPPMRGWMEDWHALRDRGRRAKRMDRELCPLAKEVDRATSSDGLWPREDSPSRDPRSLLAPPSDLAAWAAEAAATAPLAAVGLPVRLLVAAPGEARGSRVSARLVLEVAAGAPLAVTGEEPAREVRLDVEGVVELEGRQLERFRMRFPLPPPRAGEPLPLVVERALRPGNYLVRLRVRDEVGGGLATVSGELSVPALPERSAERFGAGAEPTTRLAETTGRAAHAVALLVPPADVLFGNARVQAMVVGDGVARVAFLVDGSEQLVRRVPPYTVTLELPTVPREVTLRAEARDAAGALLAADEVVLNRPRGALAVALTARPLAGGDRVLASLEVTVPEGRRLEQVTLRLNDGRELSLEPPALATELSLPADPVVFLTATARLDDGSRAEAVRVLRDPWGSAAVDVELVELLATLVDRQGVLVDDLSADEVGVWEAGRPQHIQRVERAGALPLTVGVALDVSLSMRAALRQAQQAVVDFLAAVVGPRDQAFAVAFSARPQLMMPPTPDVGAVGASLGTLAADGWTALHDALVFSLYHFRGIRDRKALVILSDGNDSKSQIDFATALDHARASGVIVYAIGLDTPFLDPAARQRLRTLAADTGGRAFFVGRADELAGVYAQIAEELQRQLLIAYVADRPGETGRRRVEVRATRAGVETRSVRSYSP